jgi:two-component system NtrC family sensor kinase
LPAAFEPRVIVNLSLKALPQGYNFHAVSTPAQPDTRSPEQRAQLAARPLRWLVAASLVLPLAILIIAGWISYQQHFDDARDRLERDLNRIYEHALKVFETFDLSARYVDELLAGASNEKIRADEARYHGRLKALTDTLPQLRDIWVLDSSGAPLVSGTIFPMPKIDLSDRPYFSVHKERKRELYVSDIIDARVADLRFFAISRSRDGPDGSFNGVTVISVKPEYFSNYYRALPQPVVAALITGDGAVLARYPEDVGPQQLPPDAPFMRAIAANPDNGFADGVSAIDGVARTAAYRRLPGYNVYVSMGLDHSTVTGMWLRDMVSHLLFGIPATIALFSMSLVALRRTERAELAHARMWQEVGRRELTERALRQSQKMEAVGRLTGGIAHDFNNLLTAILGNVDLALRRIPESDERVRRLLNSARQASERAATLVQRLLAYSRQHPLEVKSVDINKLVQGMSELLRRTIGETITVETDLANGLWKTAIDANQLENTILNLAINSRDAMPEGGRLVIETANTFLDEDYVIEHAGDVPHGQYVMIAIVDSGSGMTRDILDRAFEPFFTTKPTGVGTGLGLSMVYGFVKQSAGHIKIYSEPGEGTAIKIYFPRLADDAALPEWQPTEIEETQAQDVGDLGDTILLVEDDEEVNRFATEVLREEGYNVIATHDARSALRLLDANPGIKLLFTDIILPGGMNGRQLSDEALRRRPDLKVLYATGYTRDAIIHEGRLDADVELLNKPFTHDLLTRKVRQILEAEPSTAERQQAG